MLLHLFLVSCDQISLMMVNVVNKLKTDTAVNSLNDYFLLGVTLYCVFSYYLYPILINYEWWIFNSQICIQYFSITFVLLCIKCRLRSGFHSFIHSCIMHSPDALQTADLDQSDWRGHEHCDTVLLWKPLTKAFNATPTQHGKPSSRIVHYMDSLSSVTDDVVLTLKLRAIARTLVILRLWVQVPLNAPHSRKKLHYLDMFNIFS